MNNVIGIIKKVEGLLDEMYVLGREEKRVECEQVEEDANTRGFDKGFNEGYEEAKREFHVPDL
jgi:flagellar biosynthesis/type III secretory pathway protein FliH